MIARPTGPRHVYHFNAPSGFGPLQLIFFSHVSQTRVTTSSLWLRRRFSTSQAAVSRDTHPSFTAASRPWDDSTSKMALHRGVQARVSSTRGLAMIFDEIRDCNQAQVGSASARFGCSQDFPTLTRGRMLERGWRRCIGTAQRPRVTNSRLAFGPRSRPTLNSGKDAVQRPRS